MKTNFLLKYSITFCLFFAIAHKAFSQNPKSYLGYYSLINQAEMLTFENKNEQALQKYLEAFKQYDGFEEDYIKAVKLALKQTNAEITFNLLKEKALKTGWFTDELFDKNRIDSFTQTKLGKLYLKNKENWFEQNEKSYDLSAYGLTKSIDALDQFVRSWYLESSKQNFKNDSLMENTYTNVLIETDNKNFKQFKQFVNKNGFPCRSKLGGKTMLNAFIIHVFKYSDILDSNCSQFDKDKFYYLDSLLKIQVINGEFEPSDYAYCFDYSVSSDSVTYFAHPSFSRKNGKRFHINFPVIDPQNLNKRRAEIGLMSIEDQCKIYGVPLPPNYKSN
jgi:hypothetical protein